MKVRRNTDNTRIGPEGVRTGFRIQDEYQIHKWHNPLANPPTQIWSYEEMEPEPEQRQYFCVCKTPLSYLKGSNTVWRCDECSSYYDISTQDQPLKDITDSQLIPYSDLMRYPTADNDSSFFQAIDLNRDDDLETREHADQRVQHINLHNVTFADAIAKGALSAKKRSEE